MGMLKDRVASDVKEAMKAGEKDRVAVLRLLRAAVANAEIAALKKDKGLSDEEETEVFQREARRREEAAAAYEQGGRADRAEAERKELVVIRSYLPAQLSDDEIRAVVREAISALSSGGAPVMGAVMGAVMPRVKHRSDGAVVRRIVEEELAS